MMRRLYSLVMHGAQPFLRRKLRRRGEAEPGYLEAIDERFGRYRGPAAPGSLWIHAVSLGETRAAAILIEALRAREPGLRLLLTHGTATGRAEGARLLRSGDLQAWLPWDTPQAVAGFLNHFQPRGGVLMETEVWPNLVAACREAGVPLALANARLSEASLRKAGKLSQLSRPAYGSLAAVWAQTAGDAQRLVRAGAQVTGVLGNLKFDAQPDETLLARGGRWRAVDGHPVVMFASSREGEEAEFFRVLAQNRDMAQVGWARRTTDAVVPAVRWLVVPRHPQRFDEVAALAERAGLSVSRRSTWGEGEGDPVSADVWIGDSLGEMPLYYGLADVALLGGSFLPLGGQNLIEAAACGCPVVMGPHTFNFAEAADDAQAGGAALRVVSMDEGVRRAVALSVDTKRREGVVQAALTFAQAHRGRPTARPPACWACSKHAEQVHPTGDGSDIVDLMNLQGKRILVTHADAFMGPTLCEVLREQGAEVIASHEPLRGADEPARVVAAAGPLDVLVVNLALPAPSTPAAEVGDAEWAEVFGALVDPLPRLVRAVLPAMIARGSGKILLMGSASALRGMKRASTYSAARGAQLAYVQAVGVEVASHGVQVNAIAQNFVDNPTYFPAEVQANARFQERLRREVPLGRLVAAREDAAFAAYLCSDAANCFVGQVFPVCGGWAPR